jgi:type I restriction enzyme, S subunit
VIRGNNLPTDASFRDDDFVFVSEKKADDLRSNTAFPGDLVFTERGTLGQVGVIPREARFQRYIISQSQMKLTVDPEVADARFVYYFFRLPGTVQTVINHALTSGVPHINLGILKEFKITLPEIDYQERIADILSTYDDLIENNRRRMALLEEAARQLYREWFVRLRFPGHEHTRITKGVPEGWDDCRVSDFGQVVTGKTPSTKEADNYGGDIPFIKTPDMHGNVFVVETEASLTEMGASTQPGKFIPPITLLVSCIGTIGVVSMTSARAQFNQQINAVVPFEGAYGYYLFFALCDLKEAMEAIGGGATMGNVNKTKFEGLKVLKPTMSLLRQFQECCAPLFQQIQVLSVQNLRLRSARTLLLPRLMSGDIAV